MNHESVETNRPGMENGRNLSDPGDAQRREDAEWHGGVHMTLSSTKYLCVAGETFDQIALVVYGNEKYAAELLCANPLFSCMPVFTGGEVLNLPVINNIMLSTGPKYMPETAPWKE